MQTSRDLEQIKETSREALERETRALKDAKEAAVTEAERLRIKLNEGSLLIS